jgi:hypothetical protein
VPPRRALHQPEALVGAIQDRRIRDDAVDDALTGARQRALLDDLGGSILGNVLREHDDPSRAWTRCIAPIPSIIVPGIIQLAM